MRVVTFNILHGRSPADGLVVVDRLAQAVSSLQPDVLALQEVDRGQERSGHADLTSLAAHAMGATDHRFVAALSGTPGATWTAATGDEQPDAAAYGVALLSRLPVSSWQVVRLPALPGRVPHVPHGRRRPVLVTDEPRVGVAALVDGPWGPLTVATTHLSFLRGWNVVQLRRLVRALRRSRPLVLTGDLNMPAAVATRASGLTATGAAPTYPTAAPTRQLDHVLTAGMPAAHRVAAVDTGLSDHRALVVEW